MVRGWDSGEGVRRVVTVVRGWDSGEGVRRVATVGREWGGKVVRERVVMVVGMGQHVRSTAPSPSPSPSPSPVQHTFLACRHIRDITCTSVWGSDRRATAPCHSSSGSGNMSVHQAEEQDTCCFKGSVHCMLTNIRHQHHTASHHLQATPQHRKTLTSNPTHCMEYSPVRFVLLVTYREAMGP